MAEPERVAGSAREIVRKATSYGLVSLVCFVLNNLLLIGLDALGQPLWLCLIIAASVMIIIGFFLQAFFTFSVPFSGHAFWRYALMMSPNIPLAYGLLWLLNTKLDLAMHFAAPIATTLMLIWNAAGSAWALQRRERR